MGDINPVRLCNRTESTAANFEDALTWIDRQTGWLLDAAERELERRRHWSPWMRFTFCERHWWMRRTSHRILVFLKRADTTALCDRWDDWN